MKRRRPAELGPPDAARAELDGLIVNVELTLISVISGTSLYFLIDSARGPLVGLEYARWPYLVTGLLFALTFWARAILHSLTVIKWPIEFGHNFLYIGVTALQSILFTQVGALPRWYAVGVSYAAMIWVLFVFDQRMLRQRLAESVTAAGRELYDILSREQRANIVLFAPAMIALFVAAAVCLARWPGFFLERGGHLLFAGVALVSAVVYLHQVARFYLEISPRILAARRAEGHREPRAPGDENTG